MDRSFLLAIAILSAAVMTLRADPFYVVPPDTPDNTSGNFLSWDTAATNIQDAVTAATDVPGATVWVKPGHYLLTNQVEIGNLKLRSWPDGLANRNTTIIDGNYPTTTNRCFHLNHADALVEGFTITNGHLYLQHTTSAFRSGAGVYISAGGTIRNCLIIGNTNRAAITGNAGGGVGVWGGGMVENCDITHNHSIKGPGTASGSGRAGGIELRDGSTVRNSRILYNTSTDGGGGLYMRDSGLLLENSIIVSNSAIYPGDGSGIHMTHNPTATIRNCLIADNYGGRHGGGINAHGTLALQSTTLVGNTKDHPTVGNGTGINFTGAYLLIENSIVYGNTGGDDVYTSTTVEADHVLTADTVGVTFVGDGNITNQSPVFVAADAGNYRLTPDSPGVDAGFNQEWMYAARDVDGKRRVNAVSGIVDMGAYEYHADGTLLFIY